MFCPLVPQKQRESARAWRSENHSRTSVEILNETGASPARRADIFVSYTASDREGAFLSCAAATVITLGSANTCGQVYSGHKPKGSRRARRFRLSLKAVRFAMRRIVGGGA